MAPPRLSATTLRPAFALLALLLVLAAPAAAAPAPADTTDPGAPGGAGPDGFDPVAALRDRELLIPVDGFDASRLRNDFEARRSGGRRHNGTDLMAPRGTAILAVEDGVVRRMDASNGAGGRVIFQSDLSGEFQYYYAHLDRYADWLEEGMTVFRGQILGYVGTTGNATTPHLHFAIGRIGPAGRPGLGDPVNPFLVLR